MFSLRTTNFKTSLSIYFMYGNLKVRKSNDENINTEINSPYKINFLLGIPPRGGGRRVEQYGSLQLFGRPRLEDSLSLEDRISLHNIVRPSTQK